MLPYLKLLFFISIFGIIAFRSRSRIITDGIVFCIFLILTSFAGFRSHLVGTDSVNYCNRFYSSNSIDRVIERFPEFGYELLCLISHNFSNEYLIIFLVCSGIITGVYLYRIRNTSCLPELSIFLFITSGAYASQCNAIRQAIAVSICFFAIPALFEKRLLKYSVYVAIASIFHISAIIMIPVSFILNRPFSWKLACFILSLGGIMALFFNYFIQFGSAFLDEKYESYSEYVSEASGLYPTLFLIALTVFFLLFRQFVYHHREHYDILLNSLLMGTIIVVASLINNQGGSGIRRLAMYFTVTQLFLWPIVYVNIKPGTSRLFFLFAFCACYTLYFVVITSTYSNLVPYEWNRSVLNFIENLPSFW